MAIIGVDIGTYSIKCTILKKVKDSYCIKAKKEYPNTGHSSLRTALKDFTKTNKVFWAKLYFTISNMPPETIVRFFNLPAVPIKELNKSMQFEIQEKALVNIEDVYYKWDIVEKLPKEYTVMAAVIKKSIIDSLKQIHNIRWSIKTIEPSLISFGRLIDGNTAVIDLGHSGTRLMVYKEGIPISISPISIGGQTLTEQIAQEYEDAEKAKHELGAIITTAKEVSPIALTISNLISDSIQRLTQELKRALRSAEVTNNFKVETIYYTGSGAKLKYLTDVLSRELEYDIKPLNLTADTPTENEDYLFAAASGAWLCSAHPYFNKINFKKTPIKYLPPNNLAALLLGLTLMFQSNLVGMHLAVNQHLTTVVTQQTDFKQQLQKIQKEKSSYQSQINEYHRTKQILTALDGQKRTPSKFLHWLSPRTPTSVDLFEIHITDKTVTLKGHAQDYSGIGFFVLALEDLGDTQIKDISKDLEFTIQIKGVDL